MYIIIKFGLVYVVQEAIKCVVFNVVLKLVGGCRSTKKGFDLVLFSESYSYLTGWMVF